MERAIVRLRYPEGELPAVGWRCPACGDEALSAEESGRADALARKLGLYGIERETTRKIVRTGSSLAVTLDPTLLRDVLGKEVGAGTTVEVGRVGDTLVVRRRR